MKHVASSEEPIRVLLICPHGQMRAAFQEALDKISGVFVNHTMVEYPPAAVLGRVIRICAPQAAVVSFEHPDWAAATVRAIGQEVHGLPVIGIHPEPETPAMMQAMRAGARDFLSMPFDHDAVVELAQRIRLWLDETPPAQAGTEHIYSFLPAKPGAGSTTLAMNISAAAARRKLPALLVDLDLAGGIIRFLLNLPASPVAAGGVIEAAHRSADLDLELWRQTVVRREGLDVLHSGGLRPQAHLDTGHLQGMIDFARRLYKFICFDLSGNMEQHSLYVMNECKEIFLVSTPEPCSLRLAREKLAWLKRAGLQDRVSLVLNRHGAGSAAAREIVQQAVGVPVRAWFGNHYKLVERAVIAGSWAGPHSRLARQCAEFAAGLLEPRGCECETPETRFAARGLDWGPHQDGRPRLLSEA